MRVYCYVKRGLDVALSALGLVAAGPILGVLALLIRADSKGAAFFSQWRVGKGHRLIRLYKLRTMAKGSEKQAELLREGDIFVKQEDDPRVTRVGAVLRRLSLDELPQLYNILVGDMSFVGPRPFVLAESNRLPRMTLERLQVRPGLTGLAQVEGRGEASVEERCARDIYYVRNYSFLLDLKILLRTFTAFTKGS